MGIFNKKDDKFDDLDVFETDHRLIVYNLDQRTTDICVVTAVTDEHVIAAGRYSIPKSDCTVTSSELGRVFTFEAPNNVITEVERLARLEQSIVLQQLTNYKEPQVENPNLDLTKWALVGLLFVAIIVAAF